MKGALQPVLGGKSDVVPSFILYCIADVGLLFT